MSYLRKIPLLSLILVASLGCDDDSTGPRALPKADSPDEVVELLADALDGQNAALYESLLHEDFQFEFRPTDAIYSGSLSGRWTRDKDAVAMRSMLESQMSRHGDIVSVIQTELLPVDPAWTDSADPEFLGSQRRLYEANILIGTGDGDQIALRGDQEIFVIEVDGSWKLLFHRDGELAIPKAGIAESTLGRFKSGFLGAEYSEATTPDLLVDLFAHALRTLHYALYDELRHEEFEFQFAADEFDLAGTATGRWDRLRDSSAMRRMMNGEPSRDGAVVQSIEIAVAPLDPEWTDQVEQEFEGSLRRSYQVAMDVRVAPGATIYQIRSAQEFYAIQVGDVWRIRFQRELGPSLKGLGVEGSSFGRIKSGY